MKHILWITPGFPADEDDDSCIPPLQLLGKYLLDSGEVKITVLALHYPYVKERYKWKGISVFPCGGQNRGGVYRFFMLFRAMRSFVRINRRNRIDGIHGFWLGESTLVGRLMSFCFRLPFWVTLMGQDVLPENKYIRFISTRELNTIAISPFQNEVFRKSAGHRARHFIPWGIEGRDRGQVEKRIDILGVGALTKLKNYTLFINVIRKIADKYPEIRVVLLGDGPERKDLEALAECNGLGQTVAFKGQVSRQEVLQYMEESRVLLHTSSYESFGFVFVEALSCGMGVVSLPRGIYTPSERWETGNTVEELGEGVIKMLDRAPFFPYILYSMEKVAEGYIALYKREV